MTMKPWDESRARELPLNPDHWEPDASDLWVDPPETGESVGVAGRITMQEKAIIQQVVQSGKFRFRTESDLVRTAVSLFLIRYMMPTMRDDSEAARTLTHRATLIRMAALANEGLSIVTFVQNARKAVNSLAANGMEERAVEVVAKMIVELRKHGDTAWRAAAERGLKSVPRIEHVWPEIELAIVKAAWEPVAASRED